MKKNQVFLPLKMEGSISFNQKINQSIVMRGGCLYFPFLSAVYLQGFSLEINMKVLFFVILLEFLIYSFFYIKIIRKRNPIAFTHLIEFSIGPRVFFMMGFFILLMASQPLGILLVSLTVFCFVEILSYYNFRKISNTDYTNAAKKNKVFEEQFFGVFYCHLSRMRWKKPKQTFLDDLLEKWIAVPFFLMLPFAKAGIYADDHISDETGLIVAVILFCIGVALNQITVNAYATRKIIRMKEKGSF